MHTQTNGDMQYTSMLQCEVCSGQGLWDIYWGCTVVGCVQCGVFGHVRWWSVYCLERVQCWVCMVWIVVCRNVHSGRKRRRDVYTVWDLPHSTTGYQLVIGSILVF